MTARARKPRIARLHPPVTGLLGVGHRPLEHLLHLGRAGLDPVDHRDVVPGPRDAAVVAAASRMSCTASSATRSISDSGMLGSTSTRLNESSIDARAREIVLAQLPRLVERLGEDLLGLLQLPAVGERSSEVEQTCRAPCDRPLRACSPRRRAAAPPRARRRGSPRGARRRRGAGPRVLPARRRHRPRLRARPDSGTPARGDSRRTRRTRRPARPASRRTARAARSGSPSACCDTRRRESGCGGSGAAPRPTRVLRSGWISPR